MIKQPDTQKPTEQPIEIPFDKLSSDALAGVIENFIQREGTDYGAVEISYEKKAERVLKQIEKGDIKIVFDLESETLTLLTKNDFKKLMSGAKPLISSN